MVKGSPHWLFVLLSILLRLHEATAAPTLDGIGSFGYQLQNPDISQLAVSSYELVIIDYSRDGSDAQAFSATEIATLKNSGKKVLAYLSIGEAEEYRFYFKSAWTRAQKRGPCGRVPARRAPAWLDEVNRDFCGNYKVKYWDRQWQRLVFGVRHGKRRSYLDRIIDAGFDGAYLDIVDGYEYWLEKRGAARRPTAAQDMANFVVKLARYARVKRGQRDFIVVPQNGAEIIDVVSPKLRKRYLATIQGIGAEDTFYFGRKDEDNRFDPQPALRTLEKYVAAGKKVFAVDYLLQSAKIKKFARLACAQGFVPQVASRALDTVENQVLVGCQCLFSESGWVC